MDLLLQLLLWAIRSIFQAGRARALRRRGIEPDGLEMREYESVVEVESRLRKEAAEMLAAMKEELLAGEAAHEQALTVAATLRAQVGGRRLAALIDEHVRPNLNRSIPALARALEALRDKPLGAALAQMTTGEELSEARQTLYRARGQLGLLQALGRTREDPAQALRLGDAEAIASSLLAPLQQFAAAHQLGLGTSYPLAVPANPGQESIWFDLLPPGHPLLFIPADFEHDLYRTASIPHELGHLIWREVPRFAHELSTVSGFQPLGGLLALRGRSVVGHIDQLYTAWLSEVWADTAAVLLLGPAALRGLIHSFASPGEPDRVLMAGAVVGDDGEDAYDEHPPSHLRIHLAAHMCWLMGFDQEAKVLTAGWDEAHGNPESLLIPVAGGSWIRLGTSHLLESGKEALARVYAAQFSSLAGLHLGDVPGFEMSPGLWARARGRGEQLRNGVAFHDDGRVVLAAAIEARARHPEQAALIALGLRRAVLGRDTDERSVQDRAHGALNTTRGRTLAHEVRDALVLRELLARPGGRARRAG